MVVGEALIELKKFAPVPQEISKIIELLCKFKFVGAAEGAKRISNPLRCVLTERELDIRLGLGAIKKRPSPLPGARPAVVIIASGASVDECSGLPRPDAHILLFYLVHCINCDLTRVEDGALRKIS